MKLLVFVVFSVGIVFLTPNWRPIRAEPVTVELTGRVLSSETFGEFGFDGPIEVDSPMTGFFSYDSNAERIHSVFPLTEFSMTIGRFTFSHDSESAEQPFLRANRTGLDGFTYGVCSYVPNFTGIVYLNGVPRTFDDEDWEGFMLTLVLESLDAYDYPKSLPTWDMFPDISVFQREKTFRVSMDSIPGFWVTGEITSMTAIPEPATLLLLGLGALSVVRKRKSYD